jgi:hypothetical protein
MLSTRHKENCKFLMCNHMDGLWGYYANENKLAAEVKILHSSTYIRYIN